MILCTEDGEDAAPAWPNQELAKAWATDEWSDCQPKSISLTKWHSHWTEGLQNDDLAVVIFPNQDYIALQD